MKKETIILTILIVNVILLCIRPILFRLNVLRAKKKLTQYVTEDYAIYKFNRRDFFPHTDKNKPFSELSDKEKLAVLEYIPRDVLVNIFFSDNEIENMNADLAQYIYTNFMSDATLLMRNISIIQGFLAGIHLTITIVLLITIFI